MHDRYRLTFALVDEQSGEELVREEARAGSIFEVVVECVEPSLAYYRFKDSLSAAFDRGLRAA